MPKISTFYIEAIKIPDFDDRVHISGPGYSGAHTLCGITDAGEPIPVDKHPDCIECKQVYQSIRNHRPRFKF